MSESTTSYQSEFIDFKDQLQSFLFRMLSNVQDAEDVVQDTFITVQEKADSFQGKSSFKTWVFTIALNKARNLLNKQKRWSVDAQTIGANLHVERPEMAETVVNLYQNVPDQTYEVKEHINYCFNCMVKTLELPQQVCLWLKEVYQFKVEEIVEITELSEGKVKHALANARKTMIKIFDNKCAFVSKKGVCHQCTQLAGFLNVKQDVQAQAVALKMVKQGDSLDKELLLDLRVELARDINPLTATNARIHHYFLANSPKWVEMGEKEGYGKKIQ